MYRNKEIKIRLTEKELERLNRNAGKTTFSREGYIRKILSGYDPQASPPEEYWSYVRELWSIRDGMNRTLYNTVNLDPIVREELIELRRRLENVTNRFQDINCPKKSEDRKRNDLTL